MGDDTMDDIRRKVRSAWSAKLRDESPLEQNVREVIQQEMAAYRNTQQELQVKDHMIVRLSAINEAERDEFNRLVDSLNEEVDLRIRDKARFTALATAVAVFGACEVVFVLVWSALR